MAGTPSGFNAPKVIAGLHSAMTFGAPSRAADQATFFIPQANSPTVPVDQEGIPWNPADTNVLLYTQRQVPCAVEFKDASGRVEGFGIVDPVKVTLTLLDPDYQAVKGFAYVVIAGLKYLYEKTETPVALGTVDVWTVHCTAEDSS